ncbi:MAG: hypothetical protein L0Y56_14770, partial [Nitrospira sp.]|nr:hypothetical protein [Nitrospira sp.]
MKLRILEGTSLYQDGERVGNLDLKEGQKAGPFVIIESASGLLKEVSPTVAESNMTLSEGKSSPGPLLTLEGLFQLADTKNANNRIYPESIWKRVFEDGKGDTLQSVERGEMLGECDHPCLTSDDFRVLTVDGWKPFKLVKAGDYVWSRVDGISVPSKVQDVIDRPYAGPAYQVDGQSVQAEFTPGHKVLLENRHGEEEYVRIEDVFNDRTKFSHCTIPKTSTWLQEPTLFFTIPGVKTRGTCKNDVSEDLVLDARLFASFIGIWLSEGHCSSDKVDNFDVVITQKNKWSRKYIWDDVLSKFPEELRWRETT